MKNWRAFLLGLLLGAMGSSASAATAGLIRVEGAIGPATAGYIARAIQVAEAEQHRVLILQLDTPGGLLDSTRSIVQSFYASPVPVVVFVAPPGANAGSAGCFITLAAHVAAMAPNTSIGAAHPVAAGPGQQDEVMKEKLVNFASSYIEAIAQKRNRNVEWAKSAVRESASVTAETALELNVIELIAEDIQDLLSQLDGYLVDDQQLETAGAQVEEIPMLSRERLFQMIWRPEVMFILMIIAIYGIIGELSNPGAIIPGVTGVIALILALYMAAVLPVNIAGVALIILAVALFVLELFTPSFGILTVGGLVAFVLGALMLFDTVEPAFRLSLVFVIPAALLTAAFFVLVLGAALRAQWRPLRMGRETLIGQIVPSLSPVGPDGGRVFVEGEYWNATSDTPIEKDAKVEITGIEGLTLKVKPAPPEKNE
jgi:membrane-bound serine protease (ClpP class)